MKGPEAIPFEQKYQIITRYFQGKMPGPKIELDYETPFQLLIAVILSAQCTDKRVNVVTKALFRDFPTANDMASASEEVIMEYIKTISYPNSKAKYLVNTAQLLLKKFDGKIPQDEKAMQILPGVGRKTAHVVAFNLYNKPTLAVDTHVFRVAKRIGIASQKAKTPLSVEKEIVAHAPKDIWGKMNHWLVLHGRYTCTASKPKCGACGLRLICNFFRSRS